MTQRLATMWRTIAMAGVFSAALTANTSVHAQVKLGVIGPVTGPNAAFGAQLKNGAEQAVADINAAGGIMGKKIELFLGDDASKPEQGVSIVNKFVGDGVKFVVGAFNTSVTMPSSDDWSVRQALLERACTFVAVAATVTPSPHRTTPTPRHASPIIDHHSGHQE